MLKLGRAKKVSDPRDVALADELGNRREEIARANEELARVEASNADATDAAAARAALDAALTRALESAEAAYRVALGPVEDLKRTRYLARLERPEVQTADRQRREIALARTHLRVETRDDLGLLQPQALPPTIGTHALRLGHHDDMH